MVVELFSGPLIEDAACRAHGLVGRVVFLEDTVIVFTQLQVG